MEQSELNRGLLEFLRRSPNCFFTVKNISEALEERGYTPLGEGDRWVLEPGRGYYTVRGMSSLAAFRTPPEQAFGGFHILACHGDSPSFRIKPNALITAENRYVRLNVERYGGSLLSTWLDRPLSLAGRLLVRAGAGVESRLVNVDRDLLVIPHLAIHMDRSANEGWKYSVQRDMLPLFAAAGGPGDLTGLLAETAGCAPEDILDTDLFLYNRTPGTVFGLHNEFIGAPRLDDMQCVYAALRGFLDSAGGNGLPVLAVFDTEEVGSASRQGAAGTFLADTLERVSRCLGADREDLRRILSRSFLLSADNAHAVHPAHGEKADPVNRPVMNGGVVLKYSAARKYTTDGFSGAVFRLLCQKAEVPVQTFVNHADIPGGSTLGNISGTQVSVPAVDLGLAQLAMHSAWETAGAADTLHLARAAKAFFGCTLDICGENARVEL